MKKILIHIIYLLASMFSLQAQTLYSTTSAGGNDGAGTIIKFIPASNNLSVLISFKSNDLVNGSSPTGSLVLAGNGKLYGMTKFGGNSNKGVIFSYDPATGIYAKLLDFDGTNGAIPSGSLIQASNGKLYGMTMSGGTSVDDEFSAIFSFDPLSSTFTKLKELHRADGYEPLGSLVQASNGKLYAMTSNGGSLNAGGIFSFDPVTGTYTKLMDFDGDNSGNNAWGDLCQAQNGKLYGMTSSGGANGFGVFFSFDPSSSTYAKLRDFGRTATDGRSPLGSLTQASDGKLYGMTTNGNFDDIANIIYGVIFSYDPSSSAYTILKSFNNFNDGASPHGKFLQASDGKLYGTTYNGGASSVGVIFSFDRSTSTYTRRTDFNNLNGANPDNGSAFIEGATDNNLPTLTLTPHTGMASVNTNHCFDALVNDQFNKPVAGVRVNFTITGANPASSGFANTNSSGIAHFCNTGVNPGTDKILALQGSVKDSSFFTWTADYYSKATGDLHNVLTWGLNADGSGANPPNFTAGKTFHLANRGQTYNLTGDWTVDGIIDIENSDQLYINQFTLSVTNLTGTGNLFGTTSSNLTVAGNAGGLVRLSFGFGTGGVLKNLTLNLLGPLASAIVVSPLRIEGALSVVNGTLNSDNNITIASNSISTGRVIKVSGTVSGGVTVENYIPARRAWRIMSAPVDGDQKISLAWQEGATTFSPNPNPHPGFGTHITEGSAANGFDHNPLTAMVSVKKYISTSDSWVPLTNTNATAVNSDAFLLFVRGDRGISLGLNTVPPTTTVLRANGPLKTGNQTFAVSATGFTAIPNPFACPINFKTITRTNVPDNFYLWDPKLGGSTGVGGYVLLSANGSGGYDITPAAVSPESQFIQSGQGFLVHASGSGASIVIKESDKSNSGSANVFRPAITTSTDEHNSTGTAKGLRTTLQIEENDKTTSVLDEALTSYSPVFSNKIDDMDPVKLPNINENLGMLRDGQSLMIERRKAFTGNDTINLQLWNTTQRNYLFQFSPINLASSTILSGYLEDRYLLTSTPISLSEATTVQFSVDGNPASAGKDRFRVVLSTKIAVPGEISSAKGIRLSSNPINGNSLGIQFNNQPAGSYKITLFNNLGQDVYRNEIVHGGGSAMHSLQLPKSIVKGIYQMNVTEGRGKITATIPVLIN
ncbi:MAG: choice-of-anchor tandem repeat GloVer-containing protein [Ginsengibacter sp.]